MSHPQRASDGGWILKAALRSVALAAPEIGGSLFATLACPICWPMYAGVFGALGVGGLTYGAFGLPVGIGFVILAVGSLAYRATRRQGYRPLLLGIVGAGLLLFGELVTASEVVAFSGVGLLIVAAIWNAWPCRVCLKTKSV